MLNTLLLISVLILSLFLPFYCIDSHKNTILSTVNVEENNNNKEQVEMIEETSTEKSVVYVEELAKVSEENITAKSVDVVPQEEIIPQEETILINEEVEEKNITQEKIEPVVEEPVLNKSENDDLDHLEKLILEELNREKKD